MCTSDNTKVENYNNNEEAATILQKNGQSSFTKNGDMELKSSINTVKKKTKFWAYFWWLFGGLFGAHHVYLDRDDHAIVWFCTLGGYFGFGWFRELWRIPTYVADANDDPAFIERFKHQVKNQKKPPFSAIRWLGELIISYLFGQLVFIAIPEDEYWGINFQPLLLLVPAAVALGIWLVGNIGREQGSIWVALAISYLTYPTLYYFDDSSTCIGCVAFCASLGFDHFSKEWRLKKKERRSYKKKLAIFTLFFLVYSGLWVSYFYFNATITDSEGEEIKLSEAIKHFLTSPIWLDLTASLQAAWEQAKSQGFWATWRQIIDMTDPRGEINAYKVLGLEQTATQSEVTTKWRMLSKEFHPDKVKGTEEERLLAQEKFVEIQQAYEILSTAKNRRQRKNRRPAV